MHKSDYTTDAQRLAALDAFAILDTAPEQGFDDIVSLASIICQTPVSLVSFVANDRQWFKARVGFDVCETDLNSSVCVHALREPDLLVIEDLASDPRSADNPLVRDEPHIRFYAGAPLRTANGEVLGSLCVIDTKPRPGGLTQSQSEGLRNLARQVMVQLDLRRALVKQEVFLVDSRRADARRDALLAIGDAIREADTSAEAVRTSSEIVARTLNLSRVGLGRIDDGGEFVDIDVDWTAGGFKSLVGSHPLEDYGIGTSAMIADMPPQAGIRAVANIKLPNRSGHMSLFFAHSQESRDWTLEDRTFLRNAADRIVEAVARLDAEATQHLLSQELEHRLKNTMAIVLAIAKQTLREVPDKAPVDAFVRRIMSLSRAHDALLQKRWLSADLETVVSSVLDVAGGSDRFSINGPQTTIGPRATMSLSLLMHELATNAMKHGALSQTNGRVSICWRVADEDLVMEWREMDGPQVQQPEREGFGSRLIEMGLIGTGGVDLRYTVTGFEADFTAPLSQVQEI